MKTIFKVWSARANKSRRGFTLVEVIGVLVVIGLIIAIAVGGIVAARDSARLTSTQSDIRTLSNAIQQVYMAYPEMMKYSDSKPTNSVQTIVEQINSQLEEDWQFEVLSGATGSGAVAGTAIKRDAWNNPYGLYIYTDAVTTKYNDQNGTPLQDSDSCITIVVASAGKNSTGGPMGVDGNNYDASSRKISSASAMVNNTDGVDDLGVIVRMLNGSTRATTFGYESADVGELEGVQWIYGVPSASGGVCADFENGGTKKTPSMGGSVNQYFDSTTAANLPQVVGTWN